MSSGITLTNTTTAIAVAAGKTLTIASGATLDNQIDNVTFSAGSGSVQINGTYKVSSYTGTAQLTFSGVTFASGSTLYIGCPGAPRLPAANGGNVVWASAAGGSFLNTNPTTITGNLTLTSALVNALNNGSGNTVRVLTIGGNLIINGGVYNPQGGSGTGTQAVTVNGNVYLSGNGKLYAVNPLATGLGTVAIKGNVYIQSPTAVELSSGGLTGTLSLNGSSQQTISSDAASGYSIDGLTVSNAAGVLVNSDLSAANITVSPSSVLNVAVEEQLTVSSVLTNNGTLNLNSGPSGTATILTGSVSGSGTANVQQYLTTGRNWYISSPVTGATSATFSVTNPANKLFWYDEVHGSTTSWPQITDNATALTVMQGYVANMSTDGSVTFSGTLNSGAQTINVSRTAGQTKEGFNLIGNPYASYLDWDAANTSGNSGLMTTIWYRMKNSGNAYVFDTYNASGQLGSSNNGAAVNNHIPPMQAFWVRVNNSLTTGSISVDNTMRYHKGSQTTGLGTDMYQGLELPTPPE